ncbi:unnamed protein product [Darwinula stevensoni]|uniref:Biogenesis of lysosome-related organelles complex 1 subunit 3 n=1 Tax=Darwinula stevensoni TaxID=69355 RepID=A0A7R8XFH4_9CRUS|nr:unnamed protein product [Darwinula stevensoni]CAG0895038.1 unnamed protein product [Darwinula stevensoni]
MSHQGVVVMGEASESESEDESPGRKSEDNEQEDSSTPSSPSSFSLQSPSEDPGRRESLLHVKLREANAECIQSLETCVKGPLVDKTNDLRGLSQAMMRQQTILQDTASMLREWTNTLFRLEDQLSKVLTSNALSSFKIS